MKELVDAMVSWPTLGLVALVFGFAPSAVLRLISLAFWRDDPRRAEMRAELEAVPRWERPIWVAQQLEVAIFEGLGSRLRWAMTGRVIGRWHLDSGVELNRAHPDAFWIPSLEEREYVQPGDHVKLVFDTREGPGERMWVEVTRYRRGKLLGTLVNDPVFRPGCIPATWSGSSATTSSTFTGRRRTTLSTTRVTAHRPPCPGGG